LFPAERFGFLQVPAPRGVDREHGVEIDVEVFLGNRRPHNVGRLAEELRVEHGD
jgi:hypothetical protein